jgi:hypothetical protein
MHTHTHTHAHTHMHTHTHAHGPMRLPVLMLAASALATPSGQDDGREAGYAAVDRDNVDAFLQETAAMIVGARRVP